MHVKVCILLLAFLVYMTETVLLPSMMAAEPAGQSLRTSHMKKAAGCCHRADPAGKLIGSGLAGEYHGSIGKYDRPAGRCDERMGRSDGPMDKYNEPAGKCNTRDCNNAANCINCPLCFSATLVSSCDAGALSLLAELDYPAIPAAPVSDYYSQSWKPPDGGPFSKDRI